MPENMQDLFDRLTELWNTGEPELAAQVYDDQVERTDPNVQKPSRGIQEIVKYISEIHTGFPDFKIEMKERIGDGEQFFTEWICTGTQNGEYQGIPATGRRVEITGATVSRIKSGRIAEERVYFDRLAMLQQLGAAPGGTQSKSKTAAQ